MAKIDTNPTGYVLVAIDISKNRHDILIAAPDKKRRRRVTLMNTFEDYRRLIDILRSCDPSIAVTAILGRQLNDISCQSRLVVTTVCNLTLRRTMLT